ncbi:putative ankyrin repeat-containing domain, PGG domain, ankyrin repeat-containing domain superfamily [Helianthus annuus]|nr:putative ankyrin repeat-containing domain, PGG domain, ankyrin repeat-containing domain superfamily [Helianthus annuus]KAJ0731610.1 putative ankyrin repeat-containing domain, PGG domain, ankyrin repeat-containing domain superfamily [Helianthus annuus]
MASSTSPSSGNHPHPIYMDHDLHTIPKLTPNTVNYWKITMRNYIEGSGLITFIDSSIKPPPEKIDDVENPDYKQWKEIDDHVRSSIISTMQDGFWEELSSSFTGKTAAELWTFINLNVHGPPTMTHADRVSNQAAEGQNYTRYLPLYRAVVEGNMKSLQDIVDKDPTAVRAIITGASETALIVASHKKNNNDIVKKLISLMSPQDLAMQDSFGRTAIFGVAAVGDVEALEMMVKKNPDLLRICDIYNHLPLHFAAYADQKDSVRYLLMVMNEAYLDEFKRLTLVHALISGGFYDICLSLLQRFPALAVIEVSPLETLTYRHSAFLSGANFNVWQRMIYPYLPSELERPVDYYKGTYDIENPVEEVDKGSQRKTDWSLMFWRLARKFVPSIKKIQEKKVMHAQALQLLKFICSEISKLDGKRVRDLIGSSLDAAATTGNVEVVEEILVSFPNALYLVNQNKHGVFQIAIANRKADVFNLIYHITTPHHLLLAQHDASYNTALHLAARLVGGTADQARLHLRSCAPGAALQMQRELEWFKVVEELSRPQDQEQRNIFGKTPATIFTESHENLAKEGEQWMKDRANSGILVATLIATIVFASAITVPGGTNGSHGKPILNDKAAFIVFAVADALALLMSASSILMFLGILTARYAVQDFLYSLPKRLIISLITLFLLNHIHDDGLYIRTLPGFWRRKDVGTWPSVFIG